MGVQCDTVNTEIRFFLQLTKITLLPCANDTPAISVDFLGTLDPIAGRRKVVFSGELRNDTIVPLVFNRILFGNINITYDLLEARNSIGFAVS